MELINFLIELGRNPALRNTYQQSPEAVIADANLPPEVVRTLLNDDVATIEQAIELPPGGMLHSNQTTVYITVSPAAEEV